MQTQQIQQVVGAEKLIIELILFWHRDQRKNYMRACTAGAGYASVEVSKLHNAGVVVVWFVCL